MEHIKSSTANGGYTHDRVKCRGIQTPARFASLRSEMNNHLTEVELYGQIHILCVKIQKCYLTP